MARVMLLRSGDDAGAWPARLAAAGVQLVAEGHVADAAPRDVDAVLWRCERPQPALLQALYAWGVPVVLLCGDASREDLRAALAAGVADCWFGEMGTDAIGPRLRLAQERHRLEQERREEAGQLRRLLAERKSVERAKGILMQVKGLDEAAAYKQLRDRAMAEQRRMGEVAEEVIRLASWL